MTNYKSKALCGLLASAILFASSALPALAQTSTTTVSNTSTSTTYSTTYSTTTPTTTPSTNSGQASTTATSTLSTLNVQQQLALLQTQVIVLFGRIIVNIASDASSTPALSQPINKLKQAWVGLALNHLSVIRARFGL
jgi:hypothetical protein